MRAPSLLVAIFVLSSCGSGHPPSRLDLAVGPSPLPSGLYKITTLSGENDGCGLDSPPGSLVGANLNWTHDAADNVSLENFGFGRLESNHATLSGAGSQHTPSGSCSYLYTTTTNLVVVDGSTFTADYLEVESNRLVGCVPSVGMSCTSSWTMTLTKQ